MSRYNTALAMITALVLTLGNTGVAFLAAPLDLSLHADGADVICVGNVTGVRYVREGDSSRGDFTADLAVDRVLKGDTQVGSRIAIHCSEVSYPPLQILTGYDLVLLKKQGEEYTFARPALSSMPVSKVARSAYVKSDNVVQNLRWEIINSLQDDNYTVLRAALDQGALLSAQEVAAYVKPLASNSDVRIRALGLAACIKSGDTSMVPQALQLVLTELDGGAKANAAAMMDLRVALENARGRADDLPILAQGMNSKSADVREFASFMLRKSRNPAALPNLKAALKDSDVRVRYNAVMGFSETLRDFLHGPAFDLFVKNERSYLDYWETKYPE